MKDLNPVQVFGKRRFFISTFLLLLCINPVTEEQILRSPLIFMLTHYGLYAAGIYLGQGRRGTLSYVILGIVPAVVWHLPWTFALSAGSLYFRAIDQVTMFLGGFLIGSGLSSLSQRAKALLFGLWMVSDTTLSVLFMTSSSYYTFLFVPYSPYSPNQLPAAGYGTFFLMNMLAVYVLMLYLNRVFEKDGGES